ncbi:hydantoinase B/oxoprolinase family protein [Chachezhania sediminis]|uniref:hydantoinase B/oxoprolinase family protein n=1 Tax=Chachezhania sediminis TaxID=2599291 RepID=UPI00131DB30C|nr:hydantoinase B/oxoprolinase family protein [Chachezhania sediminis]
MSSESKIAPHVDPFMVEVIRNGLSSIAEEMSLTVMRSARSPVLREAGDLSSNLADANGAQIAQGQDIPMHMGVMSFTVPEFLKLVPKDRLRPGDVWMLNLPSIGGNHLPDVKCIRPVFAGGRIRAFAISLAHWGDIGGGAPGSYFASATDCWQEGLRIPPIRVVADDIVDEEKLGLVLANVRTPEDCRGDVLAQISATRTAERKLQEMFRKWGPDFVEAAFAALHDGAERQMRAAIRNLPNGVYEGEDAMDGPDENTPGAMIRVTVEVTDDSITFDYSGSDDHVPEPINTTRYITAASAYYVAKAVCGPDIQPSGGCYRPVKVITRPGSICDARDDKPVVGGNHETCQRIADAALKALEHCVPERLTAGGPTTAGLAIFGAQRPDGKWVSLYETHGGGEGGRADRPGADVIRVHMANVMNTSAEVIETEYPVDVVFQRLRPGSGGAGKNPGGLGQERAYRMRVDDVSLTTMFDRRDVPPYGLQGGEPGAPFAMILQRAGEDTEIALPGRANLRIHSGDMVTVRASGGGGYGKPETGGDDK